MFSSQRSMVSPRDAFYTEVQGSPSHVSLLYAKEPLILNWTLELLRSNQLLIPMPIEDGE